MDHRPRQNLDMTRSHPKPAIVLSAFSDLARKIALALRRPTLPPSTTQASTEAIHAAIDALADLGFPREILLAPAYRVRSRNLLGRLHETWGARLGLDPQSGTIGARASERGTIEPVEIASKRYLDPLAYDDASCLSTGATIARPGQPVEKTHFTLVSLYEGPIAPELGKHSTTFVVGHEIGHVLCLYSGTRAALAEYAERHACALGLADVPTRERALAMAEELFADAVGAMARPGDFLSNCSDTDALRCGPLAQKRPNALHLSELSRRQNLYLRLSRISRGAELCAPEFLSACFMAARAAVLSVPAPSAAPSDPVERDIASALESTARTKIRRAPDAPSKARPKPF
jgi:hypothetical protein